MRSTFTILAGILLAFFMNIESADAQQFVYRAKNPNFGGESFNYSWLQASAQAQDKTKDPDEEESSIFGGSQSSLERFEESLNSQLLSQLSRQLVNDQFGDDGLGDGTYSIGDLQVDIATTLDGVIITVLDGALGEQTQLLIPFF